MYSLLGSHLKSNLVELLGLGNRITDLFLLDCMSGVTGVVSGVSAMIPGIDFLGLELSEIEIVLESLEECVCFSDTVESLISSSELLFKPISRVSLYSWWLFSKNYWILSYLKC